MKKKKLPNPDVYKLLSACVERGIQRGWNRAHKHANKPGEDLVRNQMEDNVMLEISEYFKF